MITRILVPTDGSEDALEAASYAAALARQFGARVTLLHVVEVPQIPLPIVSFSPEQRERVRQELRKAGEAILAMTRKPLHEAGIQAEVELHEGKAPEVIAEVGAQGVYDLIVMGRHGTTPAARLLIGSVSEKVSRVAPCPVLIIKKGMARASQQASR